MSDIRLETSFGGFELRRFPARKRELLRAWDAADEYLLQSLGETPLQQENLLIINDGFGALGVALHRLRPASWSDSWLAHAALRDNLRRNGLDPECVTTLPSTTTPAGSPTLVLIKVPKSLALLEDQLIRLKPLLGDHSRVVVAGMVRTMPASLWQLLEKLIGPTSTSLAQKKARLIEVGVDTRMETPVNPYPVTWGLEGTDFEITNHANVFSRASLDIGTRFMLQHIPRGNGELEIIDLGCGNGVLGLMAAHLNPAATVHFVDESYMAVASARENFRQVDGGLARARFHTGDGLSGFEKNRADLVLCNPPFHQSHAIGDAVALSMFRRSAAVLREGGRLLVVGNRHLDYHRKLKRCFGRVGLLASNRKFVILEATKTQNA
jgi:16S rRNA (guanine1207-N2)-methyltransferase